MELHCASINPERRPTRPNRHSTTAYWEIRPFVLNLPQRAKFKLFYSTLEFQGEITTIIITTMATWALLVGLVITTIPNRGVQEEVPSSRMFVHRVCTYICFFQICNHAVNVLFWTRIRFLTSKTHLELLNWAF